MAVRATGLRKRRRISKKTGRFTGEKGEPLPTIAALTRTLYAADLLVSRLSTNSAGGAYATALMGALPEGQVTHAYLKSRPNISNHTAGLAWGLGLMLSEQAFDKRRYAANTVDDWKTTDEIKAEARERMPHIYEAGKGAWSHHGAYQQKGWHKLWTDMVAFSKGGVAYGHPAAKDTLVAMERQPDAQLTYHFPGKDRLYGRHLKQDVQAFLSELAIAPHIQSQVEALIMSGTHHDHSAYPALRWSIEKYAFSK